MVKESNNTENTIKFLCSYGGKILPRHTDGKLRYVGGYTRVLAVDRSISYTELMVKLGEFCGSSVTLRCQLPSEDLDTLVSITSDEDLANVVEVYDRVSSSSPHPSKIRAILSPPKSLKTISPPSSTNSSLEYSASSASKSPCAVTGGSCGYRTSWPLLGFPVGVRKDAPKVCYYPRHVQGNPRCLYLVPHWNYSH
ncbi:hypothetical protein L1049_028006 [Liquidambar formosana]|uniref:PB1 domain-containing protein n=1 Tax=Liquidambar formosana TaxID=63359 RepID=A0AAP0WVT2_LIQFO